MSLRHTGSLIPALLVVLVIAGCSNATAGVSGAEGSGEAEPARLTEVVPITDVAEPSLPVTVTTADGASVTVADASRIIPATAALAEIVFSLGLGAGVVGRDVGATFDQAQDLPVVTRAHDLSAEGVLALRPTVVLADATVGPPEALDQLRSAGVPVVLVPEAWSLEDVSPRIRAVATALGVEAEGERLIERTDADIADARSTVAGSPTVAFLYVRGQASIYLLGGDGAGADSLIEALGAIDAGTKAGLTQFTPLTAEAMVTAQPDVVLVMDKGLESVGGVGGLLELPGIAQTPAGRDQRIVVVDDALLLSFGPRSGAVLRTIAEQMDGPAS